MHTPVSFSPVNTSSHSNKHNRLASLCGAVASRMRSTLCLFLVWTLACQTIDCNLGGVQGNSLTSSTAEIAVTTNERAGWLTRLARSALSSFLNHEPPPALDPQTDTQTDAVISRFHPNISSGRIEGSLRVLRGESFAIGGSPQIWGDLFLPGTPAIQLNGGAQHGGVVSDGGATLPNYSLALSGGIVLPGKIHIHSDAAPLPSDFPSSVPAPPGLRSVNVNSQSDTHRSVIGRLCAISASPNQVSRSTCRPVTTAPSQSTVTVDSISLPAHITLPTLSLWTAARVCRRPGWSPLTSEKT
jgi:hypothetical protein